MKIFTEIHDSSEYDGKININPIYQNLIPDLSSDNRKILKASIERDGCTDIVFVEKDSNDVIDGMNRVQNCQLLGKSYKFKFISFESEDERENWIYERQLARRNLDTKQRKYLIGKLYQLSKKSENYNQYSNRTESGGAKNAPGKTAVKIGNEYDMSERTIKNYSKYQKGVDIIRDELNKLEANFGNNFLKTDFKKMLDKDVRAIADMDTKEIQEVIAELYRQKSSEAIINSHHSLFRKEKIDERIAVMKSDDGIKNISEILKEISIDDIIAGIEVVNTCYLYKNDKIRIKIYLNK